MTHSTQAIEISYIKGVKCTPARKTFKNQAAFEKWLDANGDNVSVLAYRSAEG